eukprot:gi/632937969/ref/XP_007901732.1/ PREDICTED: high affinity choline transporter 1-like [Callorhinchus milii]
MMEENRMVSSVKSGEVEEKEKNGQETSSQIDKLHKGGLVLVKPMRSKKYVTMMYPIQNQYGSTMSSLLYLSTLAGDIFILSVMFSVAAGVMSSADLLLLAASSVFAHNVYRKIIRKKASAREVIWGMLITICFIGAISVLLAILVDAAFVLYFLSGELIYSILFPQLVCVLFIPNTNAYVLLSLFSIVIFSYLISFLFERKLLPTRLNVFNITVKPQEVESPQRKKLLCVISQTLTGSDCRIYYQKL